MFHFNQGKTPIFGFYWRILVSSWKTRLPADQLAPPLSWTASSYICSTDHSFSPKPRAPMIHSWFQGSQTRHFLRFPSPLTIPSSPWPNCHLTSGYLTAFLQTPPQLQDPSSSETIGWSGARQSVFSPFSSHTAVKLSLDF